MAELRRIVRSNPLSTFRQVGPEGGTAFAALADAANQAYDFMKPAAIAQTTREGEAAGRDAARRQIGNNRVPFAYPDEGEYGGDLSAVGAAKDEVEAAGMILKGFEGFRGSPYWDVNAHRLGYGSDTITNPDGSVRKVQRGDRVTQEDADRDLFRRIRTEFMPTAAKAAGAAWGMLAPNQKAVLTSIAYNYGEIPKRILGAVRSADTKAIADAIRGLGGDNDGINRKRRNAEARMFEMTSPQGLDMGQPEGGAGEQDEIGSADNPIELDPITVDPVMVTTASGEVEPRLYSPMSGEILQAHNAAAGTAYLADMNLAAKRDIMALSTQYPLDPDGFLEAGQEYVDQQVQGAHEMFRADLRANLERDLQSRYLGIVDEKHTDIRRRADNSNRALVDRWAADYSNALASGDTEGAAAARTRLEDILVNRESLPGVAWTRAQSENVIFDAMDSAETIKSKRRKEWSDEQKVKLNTIISAAEEDRHAADEAILDDPAIWREHPELAREAAAKVALRGAIPGFMGKTPAERSAILRNEKERAVGDEWELDILNAMEDSDEAATELANDDFVAYAEKHMPEKPPQLPADMSDPASAQQTIDALEARKDWAIGAVRQGYTAAPVFFSKQERDAMSPVFGKGADPAVKAAAVTAVTAAFGASTGAALGELKADDVSRHVGGLMGAGVSSAVGQKAIYGQQLIDEGVVMIPTKATNVSAISPEVAAALPPGAALQGRVLRTAQAIYASSARGIDSNSEEAAELMATAVQEALGYEQRSAQRTTGGVQEVNGMMTLLPPGITPDAVHNGMVSALGQTGYGRGGADQPADPARWGGNGVPSWAGRPLTKGDLDSARMVPITTKSGDIVDGFYRMEIIAPGGAVTDVENEDGDAFIFNMRTLAKGKG